MPHLVMSKILDGTPGIKKDGAGYTVSEELDATVYISLGIEVLQVARLARVETSGETVTLSTHKGERFFFPPDHIMGLKLGHEAKAARTTAGFR
jgi:hypothetical protein